MGKWKVVELEPPTARAARAVGDCAKLAKFTLGFERVGRGMDEDADVAVVILVVVVVGRCLGRFTAARFTADVGGREDGLT